MNFFPRIKKGFLLFLAAAAIYAVLGCGSPPLADPRKGSDKDKGNGLAKVHYTTSIEFEDGAFYNDPNDSNRSYFIVVSDANASGGKSISSRRSHTSVYPWSSTDGYVVPSSNLTGLDFNIKLEADGPYYFWLRYYAGNVTGQTSDNSIFLGFDNNEYFLRMSIPHTETRDSHPVDANYVWYKLILAPPNQNDPSPSWKSGQTHRIKLFPRKQHGRFDKMIITSDPMVSPSGMGEVSWESAFQPGQTIYDMPSLKPPEGHPRVYFRAGDIPRIKANMAKSENSRALQIHNANLAKSAQALASGSDNYDAGILSVIESRAFDYVINGNESSGRKAINEMMDYTVKIKGGDYNKVGHNIYAIGVVYDWCYPLLTEEEKARFIISMLNFASQLEIGWPPSKQGAVVGHGPEGQLQRDLMAAAIAMYDERPDIYQNTAGRFFKEFVPAREYMSNAHMNMQGEHYTAYRGQWEILATLLIDAIGQPKVFGDEHRHLLKWAMYARRPDGQVFRDGDSSKNNRNLDSGYDDSFFRTAFLLGNYYGDPYLKWEAIRARNPLRPWDPPTSTQRMSCVEFLIFNNPDLSGKAPDDLPLSYYFPTPKGAVIARTGWDTGGVNKNSPVVVAEMKINEYWSGNHQHLDAGSFQIYYKGILATDTGYYQSAHYSTGSSGILPNDGRTGYGSQHDFNYNKRTIAHNTILVFDPGEPKGVPQRATANDGGQRFPNSGSDAQTIEAFHNGDFKIGEVLGYEAGPSSVTPDYTYLKGDLKKAYTGKISAFERSFMFLNLKRNDAPAALIVFDRVVSSNPSFKKTWLMHGLYEPSIDGVISSFKTNGRRVIYRNNQNGYNGQLSIDILLPKTNTISIIRSGLGTESRNNFLVNGDDYPADLHISPARINESGGWRMELSPAVEAASDYFLNVLQITDAGGAPLPVSIIENDKAAGAVIADRVVVFAVNRDRSTENIEFSFTGSGLFKITAAGLAAGAWNVSRNGVKVETVTVSQAGGVAFFSGVEGNYMLTYVNN